MQTEVIIAIIGVISVIITHLLDRRKFKTEVAKLTTEVQSDTIGNIDKSLDFYEKWVENTNKRLDEVLQNQSKLINENTSLKDELNTVKEHITRLTSLLCTNLPCNQRVQDSNVIDCVYLTDNKRARKRIKNKTKNHEKN